MEVKAVTKFVRISPRKARLAADIIRGASAIDAVNQLTFSAMKGSRLLLKTLNSAIANAETQLDMRKENLVVSEVRVDEGPRLKRARSKNRGGRHPVLKRMSHFTVVVSEESE